MSEAALAESDDAADATSALTAGFLGLPDKVEFAVGDKVVIKSLTGRNRECTIIESHSKRVKVHYDGFPEAFDEWVLKKSNRILGVAGTTTSTTTTRTSTTSSITSVTETSTTVTTLTTTSSTRTSTTSTSATSTTTTTPRRYVSLFCFALVRDHGYEIELVRLQVAKSVGLFDCDDNTVYSDAETWLSQGPTYVEGPEGAKNMVILLTTPIKLALHPEVDEGDMAADAGSAVEKLTKIWQNGPYFVECWRQVLADARYKFHDWVVKADPDTVFLPARLRARLGATPYAEQTKNPVYLRTCAVTPRKCLITVVISRTYGDDWSIYVTGEHGDHFVIGACDPGSPAGQSCIAGGWGEGAHTIVNQRGDHVGDANCCNEGNKVVSASHACPQEQRGTDHTGISGAMEVYSKGAVELYNREGTKCLMDSSYKKWGEEYVMQECMEYLGAESLEADTLVKDKYCNGFPTNCSTGHVAFHPLKSGAEYFQCMAQTLQDLGTPELHADLLKVSAADG